MPVAIKGLVEISRAMRKFAPDIMKELQQEVRPLLREVTGVAKGMLPPSVGYELRNFNDPGYTRKSRTGRKDAFPSYNATEIRKGLTYSMGQSKANNTGYVSLARLLNKSRPGAIVEVAGRKSLAGSGRSQSNNPNAGSKFIRELSTEIGELRQYGRSEKTKGRLLFAAWYKKQNELMPKVVNAYDKAARKFKGRLDLAA